MIACRAMSLDLAVLALYALGMLALGWAGLRRSRNQEDFLVAGRRLGPAMYMSTMAATVLGGASTIGSVRLGYVHGISGLWLCAAIGIGIIVLNLFLARPLIELRVFTVTQVLERRYGVATRDVSAVVMFCYAAMLAVVSMLGIATVMQVFLHLPFALALLLSGGLIIAYSAVGGMWAITLTDSVQFAIKTVGMLCLLLPLSLHRAGGWSELEARLPAAFFDVTSIGADTIVTYVLIYTFGILIGQDIWQRVFTARSPAVARYAGTAAGIYCLIYGLAAAIIGMCARLLVPELDDLNNAFAAVIQVALPDGIRSLVITAAMAAMMSTASAGLLAASSTLSEDLMPRLRGGKASDMTTTRWCTLGCGLLILMLGLIVSDVLSALTLAYNLLVGGLLVPLVGAVFWRRATAKAAVVAMVLGCLTAVGLMIKDGLAANTPIYGSLAVAIASFVYFSIAVKRAT